MPLSCDCLSVSRHTRIVRVSHLSDRHTGFVSSRHVFEHIPKQYPLTDPIFHTPFAEAGLVRAPQHGNKCQRAAPSMRCSRGQTTSSLASPSSLCLPRAQPTAPSSWNPPLRWVQRGFKNNPKTPGYGSGIQRMTSCEGPLEGTCSEVGCFVRACDQMPKPDVRPLEAASIFPNTLLGQSKCVRHLSRTYDLLHEPQRQCCRCICHWSERMLGRVVVRLFCCISG